MAVEQPENHEGSTDHSGGRLTLTLDGVPTTKENLNSHRFGPYRLIRILGQGGMATVYLAERDDREFRQQVAIKVIRTDIHFSEARDRFRTERQVLARLTHPGIARLYGGGTTEQGRPYLVMEYVDGVPIDTYCDQYRLRVDARLRLFQKVCEAVQHAHRHLLVHRDLKPANILVTADGKPKLLDFGIAKLLAADELDMTVARTRTGLRPMTPLYASPEQVAGEAITTASDVYSLGILLYQLLTGQNPYRLTQAPVGVLEQKILEQEPERPSEVVAPKGDSATAEVLSRARRLNPKELKKRLEGDIDNILLTALEKAPQRRYGSVEQLAEDIARHLGNRPIVARANTVGYRLGKFVRRHAPSVLAGVAVAVLLTGFSLVSAWQSVRIAQERDSAREERAKAQQVSDFLMELFEAADPSNALGDTLTVREALDRGRDTLDRLGDQPEVQATQMSTIGNVYLSLGLYDDAAPLLERALQLRREAHGERHAEVATSLLDLARLLEKKGQAQAAEPLAREALETRHDLFGATHPEVADALGMLAYLAQQTGDDNRAETLFREALAMARETLDAENPRLASYLDGLASVLIDKSDFDAADELLRDALRRSREAFGEVHPKVAGKLNNLAYLLAERGDFAGAEALYRESIEIKRTLYGDVHPDLATSLNNLAFVLYEKGDLGSAEPLFREALAIQREIYDEHPFVASAMNNLALLLKDRGELEAAEPLFRESLALREKLLGEDHPSLTDAFFNLALLLQNKGDLEAAEKIYRKTLDLDRRQLGDDHPNVAISATALGRLLHDQGKSAEAEPLLRQAVGILGAKLPAGHWRTAYATSVLGASLSALGRAEEAEPLLLKSYAALEEHIGENKTRIHDALSLIVAHYERHDSVEEAAHYRALLALPPPLEAE